MYISHLDNAAIDHYRFALLNDPLHAFVMNAVRWRRRTRAYTISDIVYMVESANLNTNESTKRGTHFLSIYSTEINDHPTRAARRPLVLTKHEYLFFFFFITFVCEFPLEFYDAT